MQTEHKEEWLNAVIVGIVDNAKKQNNTLYATGVAVRVSCHMLLNMNYQSNYPFIL